MAAKKEPEKNEQAPTKKEKTYAVLIGSLVVGEGETRKVGEIVKASEIPAAQAKFFVNDGTLKAN